MEFDPSSAAPQRGKLVQKLAAEPSTRFIAAESAAFHLSAPKKAKTRGKIRLLVSLIVDQRHFPGELFENLNSL